jgi:hypothetical protein
MSTDPHDHPPPKAMDPIAEWMLEMTASLERLSARVQAAEKSVDQHGIALTANNATAAAAASALTRIAKTEEDRLVFERQLEAAKKEDAAAEKLRSDQWMQRFWGSQAVQLLFLGIVLALLQYLGVSHMLSQIKGVAP